jgi:hypothetical protein
LDQRFDRHLLHVGQHSKGLDRRHRQTLAWMMLELICSKTVSLGAWVLFVVSRAHYAQSTVRRFSRWLHNHRIKPQPLYGPFIRTELSSSGLLHSVRMMSGKVGKHLCTRGSDAACTRYSPELLRKSKNRRRDEIARAIGPEPYESRAYLLSLLSGW